MIEFMIPGEPKSQKRHRTSFKNGRMWNYDPSKQDKVYFSKFAQNYAPKTPLESPISIEVVCAFSRPKSHFGTGRNAKIIKISAAINFVKKPDIDNCLKFVMDALQINKIWFADDCAINKVQIDKIYADDIVPGTYIKIKNEEEK